MYPPRKKNRIGIAYLRNIASSRGGELLCVIGGGSINQKVRMQWRCQIGHEWEAGYANIVYHDRWCPHCAGNARLNIGVLRDYATSHGGACLSDTYKNQKTVITMKCQVGHVWSATAGSFCGQKTWCPSCYFNIDKDRNGICKKIANEKGGSIIGECSSPKFKVKASCQKGHIFDTSYYLIKKGHWCNLCAEKARALSRNDSCTIKHWKTGEDLVAVASFERRTIEYLNENKIDFLWQPEVFVTPFFTKNGKRSTYTPDLFLVESNKWVEIKGRMMKDAQEKWTWFQSLHPSAELWNEKVLVSMGIIKKP